MQYLRIFPLSIMVYTCQLAHLYARGFVQHNDSFCHNCTLLHLYNIYGFDYLSGCNSYFNSIQFNSPPKKPQIEGGGISEQEVRGLNAQHNVSFGYNCTPLYLYTMAYTTFLDGKWKAHRVAVIIHTCNKP